MGKKELNEMKRDVVGEIKILIKRSDMKILTNLKKNLFKMPHLLFFD